VQSAADTLAAFELALEELPAGVLIVDSAGLIVLINRELERLFGYERSEVIGRTPEILMPRRAAAARPGEPDVDVWTSDTQPGGTSHPGTGRRKDGSEFPIEIGLRPLTTMTGTFVMGSVVDLTRRHADERDGRPALEEQLGIERFIAGLSRQFIDVPSDQIDSTIREGLRRACTLLGLDRADFIRFTAAGSPVGPVTWQSGDGAAGDLATSLRERFPSTLERTLAGEATLFAVTGDLSSETDRVSFEALGIRSAIVLPLSVDGRVTGLVCFAAVERPQSWPAPLVERMKLVGSVFAPVVARQHRDEELRATMAEAQLLRNQLQMENVYLRQEAGERLGPTEIVGQSAALRQVLAQVQQVAATDSTVLLLGETGTGKELFATHVHALGSRRARQIVRVNCAAIPATLIESELFGREKGAFTGALARQVGRFELADHSTIFLDEIGDLPLDVQVKLLRVLEERKFERLGSPRPISVDVRIIAATHRNLEQRIAEGLFREDLYYRLNVFPIRVPSLRERVEDIPLLVWMLVEEFSRTLGKRIDTIDKETIAELQRHSWPGNVRELRNVIERAMIVATSRRLTITLPQSSSAAPRRSPKLIDVEKDHIRGVLENTGWRIRGTGGAADRLGMKPTTLETRMAKLGLRRPHP
jgi:formate hydrogenlyase transcriptional activator